MAIEVAQNTMPGSTGSIQQVNILATVTYWATKLLCPEN